MTQSVPKLITFASSHFCEKARWALDWYGVAYEEIGWPPGVHILLAKRCGAPATTLPILLDGDTVIQGSGAIIDWADRRTHDIARSLTVADALDIERRADTVIGVHVRRLWYAETLPRFGHLVKPELFSNASPPHRLLGDVMWPISRRAMVRMYDITATAAAESRAQLEGELDWLDEKLADGRAYLAGDRFSRADVTVASLLAIFARPEQMPCFRSMAMPKRLAVDIERWSGRRTMRWALDQYSSHRLPNLKCVSEKLTLLAAKKPDH